MSSNLFSWCLMINIVSFFLAVIGGSLIQTAFAQNQEASSGCCWIDAKTGKQVNTIPGGCLYEGEGHLQSGYGGWNDPDHAYNPKTGQNFARQPDGCWIDVKTGKQVNTIPGGCLYEGEGHLQSGYGGWNDPDHAHNPKTGQNFVRVPCPPPAKTSSSALPGSGWSGIYLGGELVKNWGWVRSTEKLAATDAQTNQFTDRGDPIGVGIVAGYNLGQVFNNIVIVPFVSLDYMKQTINHNFPGGYYLGTTTYLIINAGTKAGIIVAKGVFLYGIAGVCLLNHDLNINFGKLWNTSSNTTTPGFSLGLGGEFQPSFLQGFAVPISLFIHYQHIWWLDANLDNPSASPGYNYAFSRGDDIFKVGVNFYLW